MNDEEKVTQTAAQHHQARERRRLIATIGRRSAPRALGVCAPRLVRRAGAAPAAHARCQPTPGSVRAVVARHRLGRRRSVRACVTQWTRLAGRRVRVNVLTRFAWPDAARAAVVALIWDARGAKAAFREHAAVGAANARAARLAVGAALLGQARRQAAAAVPAHTQQQAVCDVAACVCCKARHGRAAARPRTLTRPRRRARTGTCPCAQSRVMRSTCTALRCSTWAAPACQALCRSPCRGGCRSSWRCTGCRWRCRG